jgi:ELWxxDGT repeat protein
MDFQGGAPVALNGVLDDRLLMTVQETNGLMRPWAVTSTSATRLTADASFFTDEFAVHRKFAYFSGHYMNSSGLADVEPWVSNGTPQGTKLLIDTSLHQGMPRNFTDFDGITLFETAGQDGLALWRTNGTQEGTWKLTPIALGKQRTAANHNLFFVWNDGTTGDELYAIDNEQPVALNDAVSSARAGEPITIKVLANDTDSDGAIDATSVAIVSSPTEGAVVIAANGELTYTARADASGTDTFSYTVKDDQGYESAPATVQIVIAAVTVTPPSPTQPSSPASGGGGGGGGSSTPAEIGVLCALALRASQSRKRRGSRLAN